MFSENFKILRQSRGLTQAQMADKLGISISAVSMYEKGKRKPDNNMLKKICEEFRVSTDFLLGINFKRNAESQSVDDFIDEVTYTLMSQKGLMFNGKPITQKDKEKIVEAIKIATAVAISGVARGSRR